MQPPSQKVGTFASVAVASVTLWISVARPARSQEPVNPAVVKPGPAATTVRAAMADQNAVIEAPNLIVPLNGPIAGPGAIRQGIEQLRPYFGAELRLLTSAAGATAEQRREIAIEAGRTLREASSKLKPVGMNPALRMSVGFPDPEKTVRTHVEAASWPRLSNVQSARYRAELDRKARDRREVGVLNIVAAYDHHLDLDAAQREKLCESLRSNWDDRDFTYVESFFAGDTFVPIIPESRIGPILNETQRKTWQGLRKYHYSWVRPGNPLDPALTGRPKDNPQAEDDDVKAALGPEAAP